MNDYFEPNHGIMVACDVFVRVFSELYLDFINEGGIPSSEKAKPQLAKIFMQSMNAYAYIASGFKFFDMEGNPLPENKVEESKSK